MYMNLYFFNSSQRAILKQIIPIFSQSTPQTYNLHMPVCGVLMEEGILVPG